MNKRDARILSEVSTRINLPSVHIPSELSRKRKSMCGKREQLISARTGLINSVRGWARGNAIKLQRGATHTLPARMRDACVETPEFVERLLTSIEQLTQQIIAATKEIEKLVKEDPLLGRLTTCPGVGPIAAIRFVAAIDDVSRFPNAHLLKSYLGLVPGEKHSGPKQHRLGITKAGSSALRCTLVQAAWSTRRTTIVSPITHWSLQTDCDSRTDFNLCDLDRGYSIETTRYTVLEFIGSPRWEKYLEPFRRLRYTCALTELPLHTGG